MPRYEFSNGAWHSTVGPTDPKLVAMINPSATLPAQTGERQRFVYYWLGRIAEMYSNSDTKILFVKIPSNPYSVEVEPNNIVQPLKLEEFGRRPNVCVAPENAFDDLQDPKFFFDTMHLNACGRQKFTEQLTNLVLAALKSETAIAGIEQHQDVTQSAK